MNKLHAHMQAKKSPEDMNYLQPPYVMLQECVTSAMGGVVTQDLMTWLIDNSICEYTIHYWYESPGMHPGARPVWHKTKIHKVDQLRLL